MSMAVDLSTPLTDEERAYLAERGRTEEIDRADAMHGVTDAPDVGAGDGSGPRQYPLGTAEQAALEKERLLERLAQLGVEVEVKEDSTEVEDDADDDVPPYETWKTGELNAEIDRRNVGRPDSEKISKSGSVQERANRLYEDDAKSA